jgi:hypothetical protein
MIAIETTAVSACDRVAFPSSVFFFWSPRPPDARPPSPRSPPPPFKPPLQTFSAVVRRRMRLSGVLLLLAALSFTLAPSLVQACRCSQPVVEKLREADSLCHAGPPWRSLHRGPVTPPEVASRKGKG